MEEEKKTLCYSLGEGLKGNKGSVSARPYIAHMKSEGCFRDTDLWEAMAKEIGRDADYIRYLEGDRPFHGDPPREGLLMPHFVL